MPNAHVIGLGKSGIAAARLLKRQGWEVTLSDRSSAACEDQQLESEGIPVKLGYSWHPDVDDLTKLVIVSPGVPWDIPALVAARERGIETIGEMELAWRNLKSYPWIAITGTNGKTTTTALIAAILQTAGLNAPACGNIGYAACDLALKVLDSSQNSSLDWVVAEISSYQIEASTTIAPRIGVWTTFTPDHLSRHHTLENYYNIKARLLRQSEVQVFNGDDAYLRKVGVSHWADACWTSVKGKEYLLSNPEGAYLADGWVVFQGDRIVQVSALRMVGEHNYQNLLMAVAAARFAGIDKAAIAQAIANFSGVPHRLELVCTIAGVDFINDSKATNYDAAQVGLSVVASPVILIAGGEAKAGDDISWLQTIQEKAAAVLLIGDAAPRFAQRLAVVGYSNYEIVETIERAVPRSAELAPQLNARVILLSPACASFDQFQNFEQRGDRFRQLCLALT